MKISNLLRIKIPKRDYKNLIKESTIRDFLPKANIKIILKCSNKNKAHKKSKDPTVKKKDIIHSSKVRF